MKLATRPMRRAATVTRARSTLLIFGLLLLAACPGVLLPPERPTVTVNGLAVGSASLLGLALRLDLSLANPNAYGIPLRAIDWEARLDGQPVARGRLDLSETIPAKGTAPVAATLTIGPAQALAIVAAIERGSARLGLAATLHFQTRFGDLAVDVAHEETVGQPAP